MKRDAISQRRPNRKHHKPARNAAGCALCGLMLAMLAGCETDSYLSPNTVGRWEPTPVVLPILSNLATIEEPNNGPIGLSPVMEEDLKPYATQYTIGPGDLLAVSIYELILPDLDWVQTRRINELGELRLPVVGTLKVKGLRPEEVEKKISDELIARGVLTNPSVTIIVQESRQSTFSVIGEPRNSGTAIGTYQILEPDFRLLEAMALARGAAGSIKKLYVIRQVPLQPDAPDADQPQPNDGADPGDASPAPTADDTTDLIRQLLEEDRGDTNLTPGDALDDAGSRLPNAPAAAHRAAATADQDIASSLDNDDQSPWVRVDGQWRRADASGANGQSPAGRTSRSDSAGDDGPPLDAVTAQRIIEIPYDRLLNGDTRYNIVIRPGDVIRVPAPVIGNVYVGGAINRPGTFALPGDQDLTLKQLIFAAGGLSAIAIPERVDLIRRVGDDQEAVVRLNLKAIFEGVEPDIYLKPNDTINVGTNLPATPLAVLRGGLRSTYGFGFVLDRNFNTDVFGP